jgi:hypothetical protein
VTTLNFNSLTVLSALLLVTVIGGCLPTASGEEDLYIPHVEKAGAILGYMEESEDRSSITAPVPKQIAVLPATGQGTPETKEFIRIAIHNHLSALPFELVKPFQIDWRLRVLEEAQGLKATEASPAALARALTVGGLILVNVKEVDRFYGLIYAHNQIEIQVSFYSALAEEIIWEDNLDAVERSGGIFTTPFGFLATAFTASTVLSEPIEMMLSEELGRKLSDRIPLPAIDQQRSMLPQIKSAHSKPAIDQQKNLLPQIKSTHSKPAIDQHENLLPQIKSAHSNAEEGPFRLGESIQVYATGESGLRATFDLGRQISGLPLIEKEAGVYFGRYKVREGDDDQDIIPLLNFFKPGNQTRLEWYVSGRIVIDTRPLGRIINLQARDTPDGMKLTWQSASDPRQLQVYRITRADSAVGRFEGVGESERTEFVDTLAQAGKRYHYRVQAVDAAGNEGPIATIVASAPPLPPPALNKSINPAKHSF